MKASLAKAANDNAKMKRKDYEKELRKLQVGLCRLQDWVKYKGLRVMIVFEGRDAAGKGGTIKALTERVSPRAFRVVALPAPSDREKTQMFMQRYIRQFPAAGEVVIFDRSWYNRAGVEYVMGFCDKAEHQKFLQLCPQIEGSLTAESSCSSSGWRLDSRSRSGGFSLASTIRYATESLARWISSPIAFGTNIRRRAT
jgi:polyphosphate kinase 2 (PPK2 family)